MTLARNPWGDPPADEPTPAQRPAESRRAAGAPFLVWVFRWLSIIAIGVILLDFAGVTREDVLGSGGFLTISTGDRPTSSPLLQPTRRMEETPRLDGTPMRFSVVAGSEGGVLLAEGDVLPGTFDAFERALSEARGLVGAVSFDSPGGSVSDALAIGRAIRTQGLSTRVESGNICASACAYAFAGGVEREVERGAIIGVHQSAPYDDEMAPTRTVMSSTQYMTGQILAYLEEMGVEAGSLLTLALQTPHDKLYVLGRDELEATGLVTDGLAL